MKVEDVESNALTLGSVLEVQMPFCSRFCWISQTNAVGLFDFSLRTSLRMWAVRRGRLLTLDGTDRFDVESVADSGGGGGGGKEKFIDGSRLKNGG